jgi:ketosteroid isomerase-like protein
MTARLTCILLFAAALFGGSASAQTTAELAQQVRTAENGFAKTMAERDLVAFESYLADEAIFFGQDSMRGKAAVVAGWRRFFEGTEAPFSWQAEIIEVLDSGKLALSSGPVFDSKGKRTATFNSVWRRESNGEWKVVFDKGSCLCEARKSD